MCDWTKEMIEHSGAAPKRKATVLRVLVVDDPATNTESTCDQHQTQQLHQPESDQNQKTISEDVQSLP